jgi:hypothetical protein
VLLAGVVEGRATIDLDGHLPPYDPNLADQIVACLTFVLDGHEVEHFGHALGREKPGEEHVGVRQVELMAADVLHRTQAKVSALFVVEDGREHAGGVEPGEAHPVYRPVRANQSGGVQVTYDPVALYREIPHALPH